MAILLSIMAGCFAVVQAGMNKVISQSWGFSSALLLNGIVFLLFNFLMFLAVWLQPKVFSSDYLLQGRLTDFRLWWIVPGICGFLLVTGLAISLSKIGALQTFVICIAAQILCGVLWDMMIEGKTLTLMRVVGAVITLVGAVVTTVSANTPT
jgi:bacterial/archaeal transporter family-2 protein